MKYIENSPSYDFKLPERLTIANARQVKNAFLATGEGTSLAVDASGVEKIDLVGIQLIIAMLGVAEGSGPTRSAVLNPQVEQALARAGITLPATH